MADTVIYETNFSTTGGTFSDGNLTGQGTPAFEAYAAFTTCAVSSGALVLASSTNQGRYNARPNNTAVDSYAEMDIKFSGTSTTHFGHLFLRLGDNANENNYLRFILYATGMVTITERKDGGTATTIYNLTAGSSGSPSISANTFYRIRAQAVGTTVSFYVYNSNGTDNGDNTLHHATTAVTTGGTSALGIRTNTATTTTVTTDNFEWGTYASFDPKPAGFFNTFLIGE